MIFISPLFLIYFIVLSGILGSAMASFVSCYAVRYLRGESIVRGRSHCDSCGHALGVLDLLPVVGYLFLKGKCRYCKAEIGRSGFHLECGMALVFVALLLRYDISPLLVRAFLFVSILLAISLIDFKSYTIPNTLIACGILCWAVFIPFAPQGAWAYIKEGLIGGLVIGGALLLFSLGADFLLKKESMGGGDIKLIFVTGLYLGLVQNLLNLILSCIIGIIFGLVMQTRSDTKNGGIIPFGPAIAMGTLITLLIGEQISTWYLGLF